MEDENTCNKCVPNTEIPTINGKYSIAFQIVFKRGNPTI